MNLAKHPASTVQILGAEKALFRALKTKHDTPKYGLIYHASLVGQANVKIKGKVGVISEVKKDCVLYSLSSKNILNCNCLLKVLQIYEAFCIIMCTI